MFYSHHGSQCSTTNTLRYLLFSLTLLLPLSFTLRREIEAVYGAPADYTAKFGITFGYQLIILTLGLCYACIAPLILPIVLLYFCMALSIEGYNLIFVYRKIFNIGEYLLSIPWFRRFHSAELISFRKDVQCLLLYFYIYIYCVLFSYLIV